ncbi:hypothetical protein [Leeuwenhoekiella sp. NPDC079379]|uniref:hypothetical protein n=1 Tax=Leeuwenhoekiella sp. NPDC079379 TaxID=3364122 RepID=UPI0037C770BC
MSQLLYIIKFRDVNFIKIGITSNIQLRMYQLSRDSGFKIDHYKSYIFTNPHAVKISFLERNLLMITSEFKLNWRDKYEFPGSKELRYDNCLNLIFQFIEEQRSYSLKFKKYKGIDLCGNYLHHIPKSYFPIKKPIKGLSPILKMDVLNHCDENNLKYSDFQNQAFYFYLQHFGKVREDIVIKEYDKFFKV